jgi:hypothetical protein
LAGYLLESGVASGVESGAESGGDSGTESSAESGVESGREGVRERNHAREVGTIRQFVDSAFQEDTPVVREKKISLLQVMFQKTPPAEQKNFMAMLEQINIARNRLASGEFAEKYYDDVLEPYISPFVEDEERKMVYEIGSIYLQKNSHHDFQKSEDLVHLIQIFILNS